MSGWWGMWRAWCSDHPKTVLYLVAVTTANFLVNLIEVVK